jgi:NTE family protein
METTELSPRKYVPSNRRIGSAICLSGGGFRASLFHLGALRRLNELGILSQMDRISAVSGGSIIAAHLAKVVQPWPASGEVFADWEQRVAVPFRRFVSRDIRTGPLLRRLLAPWRWFSAGVPVQALAALYAKQVNDMKLSDLPQRPEYIFCATNMVSGVNWTFQRDEAGDYVFGSVRAPVRGRWTVGTAVAASSCFPPVFDPMPMHLSPDDVTGGSIEPSRRWLAAHIRLTDGGVYDNMGLEPVWKRSRLVLVSDGGAPFTFSASPRPWHRIKRYTDIVTQQARALRKRWLISNYVAEVMSGTYWGVTGHTQHYSQATTHPYSEEFVDEVISRIRTDLDAFSEAECGVLENHGYALADAAARTHISTMATRDAPFTLPSSRWADEEKAREATGDSHVCRWLGRGC